MEGSFSIEFMILFPSSIIISSNFKYGFCKNGDNCNRSHLKEVCLKRECDSRKCDKRHPTGCCKTSGQLCKPTCDSFLGVFLLFLCSLD